MRETFLVFMRVNENIFSKESSSFIFRCHIVFNFVLYSTTISRKSIHRVLHEILLLIYHERFLFHLLTSYTNFLIGDITCVDFLMCVFNSFSFHQSPVYMTNLHPSSQSPNSPQACVFVRRARLLWSQQDFEWR